MKQFMEHYTVSIEGSYILPMNKQVLDVYTLIVDRCLGICLVIHLWPRSRALESHCGDTFGTEDKPDKKTK